jgi:hypothetical protein
MSESATSESRSVEAPSPANQPELRSPLKPLLWLVALLVALIAFGAYHN